MRIFHRVLWLNTITFINTVLIWILNISKGHYLNPVPTCHLPPLSIILFHSLNVGPGEKRKHHPFQSTHFTNKEIGTNDLLVRSHNWLLETWRYTIRTQTHLSAIQCFSHITTSSEMKLKVTFFFLIYLFMVVLGLRFCARAFSSCGKRGPLFITVRGPSHCCGLSCCGAQAPDAQAQ